MIRTSWCQDQPIKVVATYSVSGRNGDANFPYLHEIPSLRAAIERARHYRGINASKGAGRVQRTLTVYMPNSETQTACGWQTHEWFVHENGLIELSDWGKKVCSPARQLKERIEADERHALLMHNAAQRDTRDLTPDAYNTIAELMLSTFFRSARLAGFRCVHERMPEPMKKGDDDLAKQQQRDNNERFMVRRINETLALSGFGTLDEKSLREAFRHIPNADEIGW